MSLRYILFEMGGLFRDEGVRDISEVGLLWLMESLVIWNMKYLREHPETPRLYESGVRYKLPEQFARADPREVDTIRRALEKAGKYNKETKDALEGISRMCGGGEHFRDIPAIMENGGGDCFPIGALVLRDEGGQVEPTPIGEVRRVDRIWGRGRWSTVLEAVSKGVLSVDAIELETDTTATSILRLTRDHKIFVALPNGDVKRITVGQAEPGMSMIRPARAFEENSSPHPEFAWGVFRESERRVPIRAIRRDADRVACADITTDDHYVYLLDPEILVSQCDNLGSWRVAELRVSGFPGVKPYITNRKRPDGGVTYHALVWWPWPEPEGSTEDPSLILGMGGEDRATERQEEIRKNAERRDDFGKAKNLAAALGLLPVKRMR